MDRIHFNSSRARFMILISFMIGLIALPVRAQESQFGCDDFLTQTAAQTYLDDNPSDPYGLDPDGNGIACEDLELESGGEPNSSTVLEPEPLDTLDVPIGPLAAPPSEAQEILLNGYLDGEMLTARFGDRQETIRLIGIDTPEVLGWECLGFAAMDRVRDLLPDDSTYYVETDPEVRDGEGQLYAYLWYSAEDGYRLLSETLLAEGYAGFVEPDADHDQYTGALRAAVRSAQESKIGIWGECDGNWHQPTSPCESVDQAIVDYITGNLEGGLWIRGAQGVRSPTYVHVYLIAGDIEGPGMEGDNQIGVWWMPGGPDAASAQLQAMQSLKGHAEQFSLFESQGFLESAEAIGYREAMDCVCDAMG